MPVKRARKTAKQAPAMKAAKRTVKKRAPAKKAAKRRPARRRVTKKAANGTDSGGPMKS
jgi:hypothetical protein